MESLSSRVRWMAVTVPSLRTNYRIFNGCFSARQFRFSTRRTLTFSILRGSSSPSASEYAEEDILREFYRDRELNGDFITKYYDTIFQREVMKLDNADSGALVDGNQPMKEDLWDEPDGGFLKLAKTQEWLSGENSAPMNKKPINKESQNDSERRKRLNFLKYAAITYPRLLLQLKKELLLVTLGVGAACSGYCLIALSVQAAVSYAVGVGFSCLYLQLLYNHADNISRDSVPQIFRQKKRKKIGIRSEDLKDAVESSIKGSGIALSSPRLVIPAAIYGLWILSHRLFASDFFDFQIVPAMFGMFAYKAAALVQVYRDNDDLQFIFPGTDESSIG